MLATIENMEKHYRHGVFAWSPLTDDRCSANPGDYFWAAPGWTITDSEGDPMLLVTERRLIEEV